MNSTIPINNVFPITYLAGSGGSFLATLLNSAFNNIQALPELSPRGNAHKKPLSFQIPYHTENPENTIEFVQAKYKHLPQVFVSAHIENEEFLMKNFSNFIKLSIQPDDLNTVMLAFVGKYYGDHLKCHPKTFKKRYKAHTEFAINYLKYFFSPSEGDRVLTVSWKELYCSPSADLFKKLSVFTDIPYKNFNTESLLLWRATTAAGIQDTLNHINP